MRRTLTTTAAAAALLALAACSNTKSPTITDSAPKPAKPTAASTVTAQDAFSKISGQVRAAKVSGTVTAENDPNHLLGRPGQYTSKITFTDVRIKPSDVEGTEKGDVERGGAIEVFSSATDATTRAKYIQTVTKSMPALAEYNYVHGAVLVRVSHYLTPTQAATYKTAVDGLS
ncbi:hypothetical protein ACFYOF_16955 [Streptomyces sp. NPDC007148]|uniref:hypothetical protein n=1 Tax=Streptomyces sp. NPDC007148 TaxID=3364775 RepID=UPI0036BB268E